MKRLWIVLLGAIAVHAQDRLDQQIISDFFAGLRGDKVALERAMNNTESILAVKPRHAEALVWHGIVLFTQAGQYFASGDTKAGGEYLTRGRKEMDEAAQLEPRNIGVRIPRGSALMAAGRGIAARNPEQGRSFIAAGLADYQYAYNLQKDSLTKMGEHPAGELLLGIADANSRLGNTERAAEIFDRIETLLPGSPYARKAAQWKQTKSLPVGDVGCIGCHTTAVR